MASTEDPTHHARRRPFSSWMKRLANLKSSSSESNGSNHHSHTSKSHSSSKAKRAHKNSSHPANGQVYANNGRPDPGELSSQTPSSYSLEDQDALSHSASGDGRSVPALSHKSAAPTVSTDPDTIHSDILAGSSAGATNATIGAREDSTFSSPAPSVRSLTTTLTTIQSNAAGNVLGGQSTTNGASNSTTTHHNTASHHNSINFSHQFPSSPPASALPSHLQPQNSATTYSTATANNLLTDNASILTLASSSKRRRRHSLDTNASIRALAPSSLWGGSRESLPLSVLSSNLDPTVPSTGTGGPPNTHQSRPSVSGLGSAGERASVYSASGIAPALTSERSSFYAGKTPGTVATDGASMHSGFLGHSRNDSVTGSLSAVAIGGTPAALPSPREAPIVVEKGKLSRRGSGWGEREEE